MKQLNTPQRKWGCGTIVVAVLMICGAIYLFPRIFGGGDNAAPQDNGDNGEVQSNSDDIHLGNLELSEQIDRDGCPTDSVSTLRNVDVFYVVAPNSAFPEGTSIFARLYRDGAIIEDLDVITANQDYSNSCISFAFESVDGDNFEAGDYEVEFIVNGNSYDSINFEID
jgi:hypothetical protein